MSFGLGEVERAREGVSPEKQPCRGRSFAGEGDFSWGRGMVEVERAGRAAP